jgi:hypothetical protein
MSCKVTVLLTDEGKQVMYKTENPKKKVKQETSTFKRAPEKFASYIYITRKFTGSLGHAS